MENKDYVKFEFTAQESKNNPEPAASPAEDQFFDLPFKARMKIHSKRMKETMHATSQELKAKAKIANKEMRVLSKDLHAKMLEKNHHIHQKIQAKVEELKASEKHRRQHRGGPQPEATKFCSACGHRVGISGKFCPACGSTQ